MCKSVYKVLSDEQLVVLSKQGDMTSIGELYIRYFRLVQKRCLSFTKNSEQSKDLAQDVMLKVIDKICSFKGESKFATWLYAITFNYCTDHVRKFQPLTSLDNNLDFIFWEETDNESATKKERKFNNAELALLSVSAHDQMLLKRKYQYNKSIKELQEIYNLSPSAVKMRLSRAKEKAASVYYNIKLNPAA